MEAQELVIRVVRGEASWRSLIPLGVSHWKAEDGWHWRMPDDAGVEVPILPSDLIAGAQKLRDDPEALREWAAFLTAGPPYATLGWATETPILDALSELAFAEGDVEDLLTAARAAVDLRRAQALWRLGEDILFIDLRFPGGKLAHVPPSMSRLAEAASAAMAAGMDSPSLRLLAGLGHAELAEAPALFERALAELQFPAMEVVDAVRICARQVAEEIVAGTIDPIPGAQKILWAAGKVPREGDWEWGFYELDGFEVPDSGGADFWEVYAARILDEARDLLALPEQRPGTRGQ